MTVVGYLVLVEDEYAMPYLVFIGPVVLLFNFLLLNCLAKTAIGYILFPYS